MVLVGCATSSFKILNQEKLSIEVHVSPDRVILECERVETDDRGVVADFMMHVIDEKKQVLLWYKQIHLIRKAVTAESKKLKGF